MGEGVEIIIKEAKLELSEPVSLVLKEGDLIYKCKIVIKKPLKAPAEARIIMKGGRIQSCEIISEMDYPIKAENAELIANISNCFLIPPEPSDKKKEEAETLSTEHILKAQAILDDAPMPSKDRLYWDPHDNKIKRVPDDTHDAPEST